MATPLSRPSLTRLDSGKLKRSNSQLIQSAYFPTQIQLELTKLTTELDNWLAYINTKAVNDDPSAYGIETERRIQKYTKTASEFLLFVIAQKKTSYERFCLAVYLDVFHSQDYDAALTNSLPTVYDDTKYNAKLFIANAKLSTSTNKLRLQSDISRMLESYKIMSQFMELNVQTWAAEVVKNKNEFQFQADLSLLSSLLPH